MYRPYMKRNGEIRPGTNEDIDNIGRKVGNFASTTSRLNTYIDDQEQYGIEVCEIDELAPIVATLMEEKGIFMEKERINTDDHN